MEMKLIFNIQKLYRLLIRKNILHILYSFIIWITFSGCHDIYEQDKYQNPEWLAGKLYTQISTIDNLSSFKKCLELTGYDTILDRTGSYSVFAPNNEAFENYLALNSKYNGDIENIPYDDIIKLVRMHIIQDAWTKDQIQLLDVDGWVDENNPENSKPRAYKRQTLLKDSNTKYWIDNDNGKYVIVDSAAANDYRVVYARSRKYVPIFFPEYFSLNELTSEDYEFYYDRPYDYNTIHYANSKVIGEEVFAENGFIYEVDQVVEPLKNIEQILYSEEYGQDHKYIKDLLRLFPKFASDLEETNKQPAAKEGLDYDTLYLLSYPDFLFDIHNELTATNSSNDNSTLRFHNGFLAPNDNAFENFINNILTDQSGLPHWKSWELVPIEIKKIILNNHMTQSPIYLTDIQKGFYSGENDILNINEGSIKQKYYGSNSTYLGLDEVVIPRAMTSVSGPVYLRPGFSYFLYAIEFAKILPAIKKQNANYSFFIIPDNILAADSSLLFKWTDRALNQYEFRAFDRSSEANPKMSSDLLSKRLLNHVGVSVPEGNANKEFIENLAGNYIIFDNANNIVSGGKETTFGYFGSEPITLTPTLLEEVADNGITFQINGWLEPQKLSMYTALTSRPKLMELLEKAGMYNSQTYSFNFISEGENYTIFAPSEQALFDYGADTLSVEDLKKLLKYHFVRGEKIFTDGKKPHGEYSTLRIDESSTDLFTHYSNMTINPNYDFIDIFDQSGNLLGTVNEADGITNIMITEDTDDETESAFDIITTSVLHDIDFVIHK